MGELSGYTVIGADDEEIGTVEDVLLNRDGEISTLILSSGGFLGIGDKTVALEWSAVTVNAEAEEIQIQMTREDIEGAPEYEGRGEAETGTE
jgi:sporulation protein YlmC with PRC-barrel domain